MPDVSLSIPQLILFHQLERLRSNVLTDSLSVPRADILIIRIQAPILSETITYQKKSNFAQKKFQYKNILIINNEGFTKR